MIREILLLGNQSLYQKSTEYKQNEISEIMDIAHDLHDTLMDFRNTYGKGRAIAAPQIGVFRRLIYMYIDKPYIIINPTLSITTQEKIEVLDDCMSFPDLLVRVFRYKSCNLTYYNENWELCKMELQDDLSELIQHEYDHLDGILATMRAIDNKSYFVR